MFRAKDLDSKEVKGYYAKIEGEYYIILERAKLSYAIPSVFGFIKIDPTTLAMQTDILDKHKVEIYGSYSVEGIESEGGDRVKLSYGIPPTCDILKLE